MKKEELTDDDFAIADEILDSLQSNPIKSLKLYVKAKPEVKKMLGGFDPRDLLIKVDPKIESDKVLNYIKAHDSGNQVGMKKEYDSGNTHTRSEIDKLYK